MLHPTHASLPIKLFMWAFCLTLSSGSVRAATVLEGYVPTITTEKLLFDGKNYPLVKGALADNSVKWPQATECHVKLQPEYQITCGTLAQVGYIDKARLLIEDGKVARVEVLELMQ